MRKQANTNINSQKLNPDPLFGYRERKKNARKSKENEGIQNPTTETSKPVFGFFM